MGLSTHHVDRHWKQLLGLLVLVIALYVAGVAGMAYVAGFSTVHRRLEHAQWWWLAPSFGAVLVSFAGYFFAYRGLKRAEGGPRLELPATLAVVLAGFGGFLAHGSTALDEFAMRAGGADRREAYVRVSSLAGFEHGVLALIVCPASILALVSGDVIPRTDFTWPWAVIPVPAFALAVWLAERYRRRWRDRDGWRGKLSVFYDSIHIVFEILRQPRRYGYAVVGMLLYWGGDMFALWAATAAFGFHMTGLAVIVALGTGMIFTRRTAPLAGAGTMTVALVPTLWYGAAVPYATATLGVAAYRLFTLWAPMPGTLLVLPKLRALGERGEGSSGEGTSTSQAEPAFQN